MFVLVIPNFEDLNSNIEIHKYAIEVIQKYIEMDLNSNIEIHK